ncbi:hypothetical protein EDD17DRAFT_1766019 [Pisolithus thermaeus]|nr:hypothetical protein EDD17DRAFT_1766019 [Pisolithus thermaeus]
MTFPHPKLQPSCPSANQEWLSVPRLVPVNRDDSSDSDAATSNFFSILHVSSLPTSPIPSDDSDLQLSSSKLSRKRASQNKQSEVKCHHIDFNYWKMQERLSNREAECQHQLMIQHQKFMHEEMMAAQELERMRLEIELEKLQVQTLALQKGVAGGESQGTSNLTDIHSSDHSV